ncbi:MAG TPA: GTP-binding protein [Chthoniobacterales bacterium]
MSVSIIAGPAATALLSKLDLPAFRGAQLPATAEALDPAKLIEQISQIASGGTTDHLFILCEPERPPMAYASLFAAPDALAGVARLTSTAFAIGEDAFLEAILGGPACLMAEQMEFVDHIFFEPASDGTRWDLARSVASALNPQAEIALLNEASAERWHERRAGVFDFNGALNTAGWRRLIDGEPLPLKTDSPVTALGYSASRPFHPERFWNFLQHKSAGVFRAKGFFWLASRMEQVGGLNLAGSEMHCASAGLWWAARDEQTRHSEMPETTRKQWRDPFGDRRQTFAVMALKAERATLQHQLDACLLTEAEMAGGPDSWSHFTDPFPSWAAHHTHDHVQEHGHECGHDHGHDSEQHDCCHH